MGRLRKKIKKYFKNRKVITLSALGFVLFLIYILILRPAAQKSEFLDYIKTNKLQVGTKLIEGREQVFYEYKGKRTYVTNDQVNHLSPRSSGKYVVWQNESQGQSQIILHDLESRTNLQLSLLGNNTVPYIDGTAIAWQGQLGGKNVIFYFDGVHVTKISGTYPAIRPFVSRNQVLYAQQISATKDIWQTVLYDGDARQAKVVIEGSANEASWPRFEGDQIKTGNAGSASYY